MSGMQFYTLYADIRVTNGGASEVKQNQSINQGLTSVSSYKVQVGYRTIARQVIFRKRMLFKKRSNNGFLKCIRKTPSARHMLIRLVIG